MLRAYSFASDSPVAEYASPFVSGKSRRWIYTVTGDPEPLIRLSLTHRQVVILSYVRLCRQDISLAL